MIYKVDLLNDDQLNFIKSKYDQSIFTDGKLSNPNASKKIKNNLILNEHHIHHYLNEYVMEILNCNEYVTKIFCTKRISPAYFLWYKQDMHYDYHIDNNPIGGVNAHMSMTCFLSDPDEYEGGELVIKVGDIETSHKLKAGQAIFYPTGLWHKVNRIVSGERKAFVCWMENLISDSTVRNYLIEYGMLVTQTIDKIVDDKIPNASKLIENLEQFRINLMRHHGTF